MSSARKNSRKKPATEPSDKHELLDFTLESGISGTTNWHGEPIVEANSNLRGTSGFGVQGSYVWGEWEKISKTDPDVAAVLEFVIAPIRDAAVSVVPAVNGDKSSEAHAAFVQEQIDGMSPGWSEYAEQVARSMLVYGFGLHEMVLAVGESEHLPGGSGYVLDRLAERLPRSIHPSGGWIEADLESGRELAAVKQLGQTSVGGSMGSVEIPAEKLLLASWQRSGLNYGGVSAFRPVWYLCRIREQLLKLAGIASVREGAGIPVAYSDGSDSTLTPGQQRKLARALQNLVGHEHASMVMPAGWRVEWIFSPGANKGHVIDLYNSMGQLILRQLGAQQLALGTGETGSRSVGEVHDAVAAQYVAGVIRMIEQALNGVRGRSYTGLARKLVEANWGPQKAYPRITIQPRKRQLPVRERVEAAAIAIQAGLLRPTDADEAMVREELGLGMRTEQDEEIQVADDESGADVTPENLRSGKDVAFSRRARGATCGCGAKHRAATRPTRPEWSPWRELSKHEQRVDFKALDSTISKAREEFEAILRPVVGAMVKDAAPDVGAALAARDPSALLDLELDTAELEKAVGAWLAGLRAQGKRDVVREVNAPDAPEPVQLARPAAEADAARWAVLEAQKASVVKRIVGRLQSWISREAIEEVRQGTLDSGAVVRDVLAVLDESAALRTDAGSAVARAYNVGREEAAELVGATQAQYSAILDSNVCQACLAQDGMVYELGSNEYEQALPPNRECEGGDNCRCVMVYISGSST